MKRLERVAFLVIDALLFVAVRFVFVEATFGEVRERAYPRPFAPPPHRISEAHAQFLYQEEKRADEHVYDKVKQLLILTAAAAAYLSKDSPRPLLALLSVPLLAAVFICAASLSVAYVSVPDYSDPDADSLGAQWALDLAKATQNNLARSSFRTDLYRASLRWLVLGFVLILAVPPLAGTIVGSRASSASMGGHQILQYVSSNAYHYVAPFALSWAFLSRVSWNPFFGGIFGGGFAALLGAIIGGRYVVRSAGDQRKLERLAAGRALSTELELNIVAAATLVVAGRDKPRDYLIVRPTMSRRAFDERLTFLSELLTPFEFFSLCSLYAKASLSFSLLENQARRGADLTPGAIKTFTDHAEEFAIAAGAVAARVWPEDQQQHLRLVRDKLLGEVRNKQTST